jgi:hypothetical protein
MNTSKRGGIIKTKRWWIKASGEVQKRKCGSEPTIVSDSGASGKCHQPPPMRVHNTFLNPSLLASSPKKFWHVAEPRLVWPCLRTQEFRSSTLQSARHTIDTSYYFTSMGKSDIIQNDDESKGTWFAEERKLSTTLRSFLYT